MKRVKDKILYVKIKEFYNYIIQPALVNSQIIIIIINIIIIIIIIITREWGYGRNYAAAKFREFNLQHFVNLNTF